MFETLIALALKVVVLLVVVPAVTSNNVQVRQGGFIRGLLILLCIGLINMALWPLLTMFTLGTILLVQVATFGLVGVLVNAVAIYFFGNIQSAFYVKNFGSAVGAAITMSVANVLIQMFLY